MLLNLEQLVFYIYTFLHTRETLQIHLLGLKKKKILDLELPVHLRRVILGLSTKYVPSVIKLRHPESDLRVFENLMDKN